MKKTTAFDEFFSEPVDFDGTYVVSAEGLWSEDSIVDKFCEYFKDWNWIDLPYLKHQIRNTQTHAWVKWHAGINEDGEPQNMWWLYREFPVGKKGYKTVYIFSWDKHYVEKGHRYQPVISEQGKASYACECETCTKESK